MCSLMGVAALKAVALRTSKVFMTMFLNRSQFLKLVFATMFSLTTAVSVTTATAQTVLAPDELVKKLSSDVLDKIRSDKDIQAGNFKKLSDFVDTTVMPSVNFERMTALSVGRTWRQATPEQQKKLMVEFRALLLRTYSSALGEVRDETIRMKPLRADPADSEVIVRSEIVRKRGEPIQLDYRMEKTVTGWKIYDVNVIGVWLIESYRNQFAQEINAKGLESLITTLTEKNKKLDQAK
jgi:phospholipid transport system substrate-binding protein